MKKAEAEKVMAFMKAYQVDSNVEDLDAALIVISRSTHEVFHYLYREGDDLDKRAVLSSLITMVKTFLLR